MRPMAPLNRILIIFLVAMAVVAAALHPCAATRVKGKAKAAANADQDASSQPLFIRPRLPHQLPIHCIPASRPRHPFLPPWPSGSPPSPSAPSPPAEPSECYTPLTGMLPCADFLTKRTGVRAPPSACCDGLKAVVKDASICMCHVVNHGFSKMLPAPMLRLRMMMLPRMCRVAFPGAMLGKCIRGHVPPMNPPATPPTATPPESPSSLPPESPSAAPPTPAATPPPESPSAPPPAPAAKPPVSP